MGPVSPFVDGLVADLRTPAGLFLGVSLGGALFSLNGYRPFARQGPVSIGAFFAGWLTAELPLQHLAWQVLVTALFLRAGVLGSWPGLVGLGLSLVSWAALVRFALVAGKAEAIVEQALTTALGDDYLQRIEPGLAQGLAGQLLRRQLFVPFFMGHPQVVRTKNLAYGKLGRRNRLDVYRRRDLPQGCPVLLQVHGGAWAVGNKEQQGLPLVHYMASLGWVVVTINYRLSPRAVFPDHIVDVKRAIAWVKANVATYGGDPGFVAITGGSAGGHLSSLAALTPNDPAFQPGFEDADTTVQACVPFYGVYDFTNRKGLGRRDMRAFLERIVFKKRYADDHAPFDAASPMSRITKEAPPFFVIHGTNDTVVPVAEARLFVELLRATSRAPVAFAELPDAQHAFEVFASLRTRHVVRGVARFLAFAYSQHRRALDVPRRVPADAAGGLDDRVAVEGPERGAAA